MISLRPLLLGFCTLFASFSISAQVTSPLSDVPSVKDDTPLPFPYPNGFAAPQYELDAKPAPQVTIGDHVIELGKTKLSEMARYARTELKHTQAREDFLCFSTPAIVPKAKRGENFGSEYQHQNIWFLLGDRGQIREVRTELVAPGEMICPPFSFDLQPAVIANISIGERAKDALKKIEAAPQAEDEDGWKYWYSQDPNLNKPRHTDINLLGIQEEDGRIKRMISLVETYKN